MSCTEQIFIFIMLLFKHFKTSPYLLQLFRRNAAMLFYYDAPNLFYGLQKKPPLTFHQHEGE